MFVADLDEAVAVADAAEHPRSRELRDLETCFGCAVAQPVLRRRFRRAPSRPGTRMKVSNRDSPDHTLTGRR